MTARPNHKLPQLPSDKGERAMSDFHENVQAISDSIDRRDELIGELCDALAMSTAEMERARTECMKAGLTRTWASLGAQCDFNRPLIAKASVEVSA